MKNIFPLLTAALFLLCSNPAQAAPPTDRPLMLAELIDIALQNHPSTKQAWWNANRAAASLGLAKCVYYPDITFAATATRGRDFKFINGPDTNYTIVGADLFLSVLLIDFGERKAAVDSAKSALTAANWQFDWQIQKVMVRVLENAYATLLAREVLQAAEISLIEAERVLNAAKELNRTGLTPITDIYTTQATYYQTKMEVAQHKAALDIQKGKLAASVGLCASSDLEIAVPDKLPLQQIEKLETLIDVAFEQRADLMAKQARLQETFYNQVRTKNSFWPKVSLNGRGGYNKAFHDKTDGGQYQLSLNFEVPLFNGFDVMHQNRMAYADTQISTEALIELQLEIALEVLTCSRTLQAAQEMLPDAEENLNSALNAYEGVLQKYKAGKEGIAEVSWAQRQLAMSRVRHSEVKTKLLVSMANLAYATGTLAPYMETPCQEN